jgi:hypothetical protein
MIKGCIGFTHVKYSWLWNMLIVRGKKTYKIPLPFVAYCFMVWLYKRGLK